MRSSAKIAFVALFGIAIAVWAVAIASPANSVVAQQAEAQQEQASGIQYAQLRVNNGSYVFDVSGSDQLAQSFNLNALYRRLGGRSRAVTFVNLLGVIGDQGWQLVDVSPDQTVYTFAR